MNKYIKMFKIITHQGNAVKTTVKYTAYIYPYNSAVLLLGTFLGEMNTFIHKKTHIRIIVIASHQVALVVKNPPTSEGDIRDASLIPGSGRSRGEGNGNPLQYSCLENPVDTVHRVAKSWTRLSDFTHFTMVTIIMVTVIDLGFLFLSYPH